MLNEIHTKASAMRNFTQTVFALLLGYFVEMPLYVCQSFFPFLLILIFLFFFLPDHFQMITRDRLNRLIFKCLSLITHDLRQYCLYVYIYIYIHYILYYLCVRLWKYELCNILHPTHLFGDTIAGDLFVCHMHIIYMRHPITNTHN